MALDVELGAVEGDDAGRFLAAMLQGVQAERHHGRRVRPAENAEHAAFFVAACRRRMASRRSAYRSPLPVIGGES